MKQHQRSKTRLSVNVNKVALLRNSRSIGIPDVRYLAQIALQAGADGITIHPRPDGRHIRADDVRQMADLLKSWPKAELNIEGNPFHGLMDWVREVRPHQCTLVPDDENQSTSDHGWNLMQDRALLKPVIDELKALNVRVSLFLDPDPAMVQLAKVLGADCIELYTEPWAAYFGTAEQERVLDRYRVAGQAAHACSLCINAGHDLNLRNLGPFLEAVPGVAEVSIGHALIGDALEWGMAETVQRYLSVIDQVAVVNE